MIRLHHISSYGRVAVTLLFLIGIFSLFAPATQAQERRDCVCVCGDLPDNDPTPPDGFDPRMCPPPIPDFCGCPTEGCDSVRVCFTDLSEGYIERWYWDFGDPASGLENNSWHQHPVHTYRQPGSYSVKLYLFGYDGDAELVKEHYITVRTGPTADFIAKSTTGCVMKPVYFENRSTGDDTWHWEFGDGATSPEENPSHTYSAPGVYDVSLTVSNICGTDTKTKYEYIVIAPKPIADFTADKRKVCVDEKVTFTDLSQYAEGWHWEFGDGDTSPDPNPQHAYASPGVYTVSLTVDNPCGDDTETKIEYITVDPDPVADFTSDIQDICPGDVVTFTDKSQYAETWHWEFGDGATSPEPDPRHTYTTAGVYTVSLTVTNDCGEDTKTRIEYITVYPEPFADFISDTRQICVGGTVYFTEKSKYADTWYWEFGDGGDSPEPSPSHTYNVAGVYTVSLKVTNDCGDDTETKELYITVLEEPIADFTADKRQICTGQAVNFTDESTLATSWSWNFGDGATSIVEDPRHVYTSPGIYTVSLTVEGDCGDDTETKELYITVLDGPEAAFYTEMREVCKGAFVYFYNESKNADSYVWDFGDGATSPAENPSHAYTKAGLYTVKLTATNGCGDDTETKEEYITVHPGPTADFSATPRSGTAPLDVEFTDHSTTDLVITSWSWTFGDGGTSDEEDPSHTYTSAGTYPVTLTVTDDCGSDSETKLEYIYVIDTCSVEYSAEPTEGCAELTVDFSATDSGPCEISSWTWEFGDPESGQDNIATGQNVQHIYKSAGIYDVKLTAVDVSGTIVITKEDYITVYGGPIAAFTASPDEGVPPLFVNFTDMSDNGGSALTWKWDFGDPGSGGDNASDLQHPNHLYNNEGTYNVSLIVTNDCGVDTAYGLVTVLPGISIIKEVDRDFAGPGDVLTYTLTVINNSPFTVYGMNVADTIPDSSSYVDGSITSGGVHDSRADIATWNLDLLDPYQEIELSFKVLLDGPFSQFPTMISNYAFAAILEGPNRDYIPRIFYSDTVFTQVDDPTGLLGISKEVSATLASPGDQLTYTIIVTNLGPTSADNVVVLDAIPDSTTYIAGSITNGGTYDPADDSLMWDLGTLNAFQAETLTFNVSIDPDVAGGQEIPNTAFVSSSLGSEQSNEVLTAVSLVPIVVTKTVDKASGMIGDIVRFTITIENYSGSIFTDVHLIDTMEIGLYYVDGTSLLNGAAVVDPIGDNPYDWSLGDLSPSGVMTVEYTTLIGASAHPGINENIARAAAFQGGSPVSSNRAVAEIFVLNHNLTGSIRGIVVVDCDGDGIADMEYAPVGADVYLDDGSHSKVNEKGMFYFSTVRPGERVVALDERDLEGYYIPDDAEASVFVHVHETGESYVIFRICPEYPQLNILKQAAIIPTVKVTKTAKLSPEQKSDSLGVKVDYQIDIKSNGLDEPMKVRVVDSLPDATQYLISGTEAVIPRHTGNELVYEVTAARERMQKSVFYSLRDLSPGQRKFLTNKVYVEGALAPTATGLGPVASEPVEVSVGPLLLAPPQDVMITLTPALFVTSKAFLQPPAFPQLQAVADSIDKYADASVKVEGHCDYRRINTKRFPSNWELGEARAKAVVDWLVENRGVDSARMVYESFAATRPVDSGMTMEALQRNRRTEVILGAKIGGFMNPTLIPDGGWKNSTTMVLDPVKFDTLFEKTDMPVEVGLDDSWEVVLTVENTSEVGADDAALSDILPDGVEYVTGSAMVDGVPVTATTAGNVLSVTLKRIEPLATITLRYRVRALAGSTPTGGGAASVEVMTAENLPVVQKSNEVRFK